MTFLPTSAKSAHPQPFYPGKFCQIPTAQSGSGQARDGQRPDLPATGGLSRRILTAAPDVGNAEFRAGGAVALVHSALTVFHGGVTRPLGVVWWATESAF